MTELYFEIDEMLKKNNYVDLFELMERNRDSITCSNELSFFYYLCQINKDSYNENRDVGLLRRGTFKDILSVYFSFRRMVQRAAYCEEYDTYELLTFMKVQGISARELLWTVNSSVVNPEETLSRIKGIHTYDQSDDDRYVSKYEYKEMQLTFIICSNNISELEEAKYYIERLYIPEGVTIDVIEVREAVSMCSGYNEGMQASSAQYKVYMHQDVRIIDRFFIPRLIDIFLDDHTIGMIGFVGTKELPDDGIMWNSKRYGCLIETHVHETLLSKFYEDQNNIDSVLCDGFVLATSKDIVWREDLFDGWDFYDASQCMEFIRRGYRVVVPYQKTPWLLHDCGFLNLNDYEEYRVRFVNEYINKTTVSC